MQANSELLPVEATAYYRDNESGYLSWLATNPDGFVLNIRAPWESHTHKLHKSACKAKDNNGNSKGLAPFTGGMYSKVCSLDPRAVLQWAADNIPNGTARVEPCGTCKPDLTIDQRDTFASAQQRLEDGVAKSLRDRAKARSQRLEQAPAKPTERYVLTRVFDRNPDVIAEVLHRVSLIGVMEPFRDRRIGAT